MKSFCEFARVALAVALVLISTAQISAADDRPSAQFTIDQNFNIGAENDSITSGTYNADLSYGMRIDNDDDDSGTTLGELEFRIRADDIKNVHREEYAKWNESYAEQKFPPEPDFIIGEHEGLWTGVNLDYQESKYLNLNLKRWFNQTTFNETGYQLVSFSVEFENKNFEWAWCHMAVGNRNEVHASIVPNTFETNAPGWKDENEDNINFNFDKDKLQTGVTYNSSFVVKVEPKTPVVHKPKIHIGQGLYRKSATGKTGYAVEMPSSMLPENVRYASVKTNVSNAWRIERKTHLFAELNEVVENAGPHAKFSLTKDFNVRTQDDSITSGTYDIDPVYNMQIHNNDDNSGTILGNLEFRIRADDIKNVHWKEYAEWNESYAEWKIPPGFVIKEHDGEGTGVDVNRSESKHLNLNINRWFNQTSFNKTGYQLVSFTVEFEDKNFEGWGEIEVWNHDEVSSSIVPGTFKTDAPIRRSEEERRINLNFDEDALQSGVTYNFSFVVKVEPKTPVIYKPQIRITQSLYSNSTTGETGYAVEMPSSMLPEDVKYASVATNVSNVWEIERNTQLNAELDEVVERDGPHSEFSLSKNFNVRTQDDSLTSGTYDTDPSYNMHIHNRDDNSNTILGDLEFRIQADNIKNVDRDENAEWSKSYAEWKFPSEFIEEDDGFGHSVHINHSESKHLNLNINRWFNQTSFNETGYQLVIFTVEFEDTNFEWVGGNIEVWEHDEVDASIVPGTFKTDAPVGWNEGERKIDFGFDENALRPGVTYNFSVVVKVEPKTPVIYKPQIRIDQDLYRDSTTKTGYAAEIPSYMLPENVRYASVVTNVSNAWWIERKIRLSAELEEVVTPPSTQAASSPGNNPNMTSTVIGIVIIFLLIVFISIYFTRRKGKEEEPESLLRDVFISAASADYDYARQVYDFLTENGVSTFYSEESIPNSNDINFRMEITKALGEAQHMIVVVSSVEYAKSFWVETEWGFFIKEKRSGRKTGNVITLTAGSIQPSDLPPGLRGYEVMPFGEESFEKLLSYVERKVD